MVNFKDKNMPAVIDKALDFIGAMDVSAPTPSSMNESTAKGIFKYLKEGEKLLLFLCKVKYKILVRYKLSGVLQFNIKNYKIKENNFIVSIS